MTGVIVQVPGKVMLAGEYSVLGGGRALAATVNRALAVEANDRPEFGRVVMVESNLWSDSRRVEAGVDPAEYREEPLLEAVARGMELYGVAGAEVKVGSSLEVSFGIGSSSAIRLAVMVALEDLARLKRGEPSRSVAELWPAAREALRLQRNAQKQASGYDIATQLVGGLALFTPSPEIDEWPASCSTLPDKRGLEALNALVHVYVGGRGAPTGRVTTETLAWLGERGLLHRVHAATEDLIEDFHRALAEPEDPRRLAALARAVQAHRRIFGASPHFPAALAAALEALPDEGRSWSFKTTGAGGEDALLLIGPEVETQPAATLLEAAGWRRLPTPFTAVGTAIRRQGAARG